MTDLTQYEDYIKKSDLMDLSLCRGIKCDRCGFANDDGICMLYGRIKALPVVKIGYKIGEK